MNVAAAKVTRILINSGGPNLTDWRAAGAVLLGAVTTVFFAARQTARQQVQVMREVSAQQWYPLVYAHEGEPPRPR
jgi:hypothetical protein